MKRVDRPLIGKDGSLMSEHGRLIDADALIEKTRYEAEGMPEPFKFNLQVIVEWLAGKIPTIEPRKGKWISKYNGGLHYCSLCGWALMDCEGGGPPYMGMGYNSTNEDRWMCWGEWRDELMNYCPNCGADMREENVET